MEMTRLVTADELAWMPDAKRYELVRGELVYVPPVDARHGLVLGHLAGSVGSYVRIRDRFRAYLRAGVILERDPDTVLGPDVSIVPIDRLSAEDDEGFLTVPPTLVIEVASMWDTIEGLRGRIAAYMAAGVALAWLAEPKSRTVTFVAADGSESVLTEADVLDGGDILPGFRLPVAEVFL